MRAFCLAYAVGLWGAGCGKVVKIDYDAGMTCEPLAVTPLAGPTAAVWLGESYAAVWSETRETNTDLYFGMLDAAGQLTGAATRITEDAGVSRVLSLVATGTAGYGVLYEDDRDAAEIHHLYVARLDENGARVGDEIAIGELWGTDVSSGDKVSSVLVWNGSQLATAWVEDRDDTGDPEVYFASWTDDPTPGADVRINTAAAAARDVSLVVTDDGWGLAWSDTRDAAGDGNSEIYAVRLDVNGQRMTEEDVRVTDEVAFSVRPALASNGSELAIAWIDNRTGDSELYVTRLDDAGQAIGDILRVTEDPSPVETKETPALLHDDDGYALAWSDRRDQEGTPNNEVYFARIGDDGARIGAGDVRVTSSSTDSRATDVLRSGETFTLLGEEVSGDEREGWIATICPEDL